jgi:hypothetical protein
MNSQPALVYIPKGSEAEINEYLKAENLYWYDHVQETASDMARPSAERPILLKNMFFAAVGGNRTPDAADKEPVPRVFVTDHLSTLGGDRTSQAAVVGALMNCGMRVHADYREIERGWFYDQVPTIGYSHVDPIMASLQKMTVTDEILDCWKKETPDGYWILSTSHHRRWSKACDRAEELVDQEGMTIPQTALQLTVEGYHNKSDRVLWYPEAVREAYEAATL